MKKLPINFSWPASLSDFSTDKAQGNFSRGKLKVFYKGETADHRYFSDEFSEELIKSLPYTPVVSYYDEEKDDFVGHATEQQIFGMVDPLVTPVFECDEDGYSWAVCDVVLYTERPDRVGELAKKIVGHKQSLELDPNTVKYTINYDEKRHFKNIEFTAGTFVGVSVLGSDQQPAFTGSEFFSYNEDFENKMKILREYCEHKNDFGGQVMNLQEFMKLSWGDISSKVNDALYQEYGQEAYTMIVDMFNDSAIVRWYSYLDGSSKLMRVYYSCDENGNITLGNVNEVIISYEDVPSNNMQKEETGVEQATETSTEVVVENAESSNANAETAKEDDDKKDEESKDDNSNDENQKNEDPEEKPEDASCDGSDDEDKKKADAACDSNAAPAAQVINAEVTAQDNEKASVEDNENFKTEEDSSSTSLVESQRAELEELKREKKITLLDSFKQYLSEDEINDFTSKIDDFSEDDLERELLKKYKAYQEDNVPPVRAFALRSPENINANNRDALDSFVRKYRR